MAIMSREGLGYAWHIHENIIVERLREPIEMRQEYIRAHKSRWEQALRLRLLHPVQGTLPEPVVEAAETLNLAWKVFSKAAEVFNPRPTYLQAWKAYDQAEGAYSLTLKEYKTEIEALHAIECPNCPWDGTTIFSTP